MKVYPKIIFLLISLINLSCGGSSDSEQQFQIQLIDGIKDIPVPNMTVQITYSIGGTYVLDFAEGTTDNDGMITLETSVDLDTIQSLLDGSPSLDQRNVHQTISIVGNNYFLYELEQDTVINRFRPKLNEDQLIIAKVYETIPLELQIIDEVPLRERSKVVEYTINQFHPNFFFELYGSALDVFTSETSDTMTQILFLGDGVDYRVGFAVSNFDTINMVLDTISQSSINFTGDATRPDVVEEFRF